MKRIAFLSALLAMAVMARAAEPKEEVIAAAKKLAAAGSYSWKQTSESQGGGGFGNRPQDGSIEKDLILINTTGREDAKVQMVKQGEKGARTNQDGEWESLADLEAQTEGFGRFMAGALRNLRAPAAVIEDLAKDSKELKKDGDAISGALTEEGAKKLMSFGGRGGQGFEVKNASANVKFWIKDGMISKFQYSTKGTFNFNNEDREIDRTTTVEINKVGETKVSLPEGAKKKLS